MHAGQFSVVGFCYVNIERLTLVDVSAAIGSHLDNVLLRDFPGRLVQLLQVIGNAIDILKTVGSVTCQAQNIHESVYT